MSGKARIGKCGSSGKMVRRTRGGKRRGLGWPRLSCASAASPPSRKTFLQAFNMTHAQGEQFGGARTRQILLHAPRNDGHSLQFLLTQRDPPLSIG